MKAGRDNWHHGPVRSGTLPLRQSVQQQRLVEDGGFRGNRWSRSSVGSISNSEIHSPSSRETWGRIPPPGSSSLRGTLGELPGESGGAGGIGGMDSRQESTSVGRNARLPDSHMRFMVLHAWRAGSSVIRRVLHVAVLQAWICLPPFRQEDASTVSSWRGGSSPPRPPRRPLAPAARRQRGPPDARPGRPALHGGGAPPRGPAPAGAAGR